MTDDHSAEVEALSRRFPGWTVWFGSFTGHWWALPPRHLDIGDFVEAETPRRLIARIEVIQHNDHRQHPRTGGPPRPPRDLRRDARRPSNLLRLEGVTPSPPRRGPVTAWPGSTAR